MASSDRCMAQDGYKPITEGYQPGKPQPAQKGYTPATGGNAQQQSAPPPPSGGSSASKPPSK
jgi:hypothetical protein